jgi:hypothetical protein
VAFLNWRFRLTPTKPVIIIPITLYLDMGMVMMTKKGLPRDVQWAEA